MIIKHTFTEKEKDMKLTRQELIKSLRMAFRD